MTAGLSGTLPHRDFPQDNLALVATRIETVIHHHNAVQLVVSLDRPYPATLGDQELPSVSGFLIAPNVPHACRARGSTVLVVSIDATSRRGRGLTQRVLAGRPFCLLEDLFDEGQVRRFQRSYSAHWRSGRSFDPLGLLRLLWSEETETHPLDQRVQRALELLDRSVATRRSVSSIARDVGLSQRRLRHLFQEGLGLSMSGQVLWLRIKRAVRLMKAGSSLSEAAARSGFSDQAHLTRTFKRMFGVSPALMRQNAKFLRAFG